MKNKKKTIVLFLTAFCFVGIISTLVLMINWKKDVNANKELQQRIEKVIGTNEQNNNDIDFDELRKINSDTVGYFEVPSVGIKYAVVKGKDNSYYLNHNFKKENNVTGWIFMDYKNKADGTDKNMIIYGHNTVDGSMFGSLAKLLDENKLKDEKNLIINFSTDQGRKKYKIFSIYKIDPEEYYITTSFKEDEFETFKERIKERSIYKLEATLDNKNIITLSTCQNHGVKRLVIHAVEI